MKKDIVQTWSKGLSKNQIGSWCTNVTFHLCQIGKYKYLDFSSSKSKESWPLWEPYRRHFRQTMRESFRQNEDIFCWCSWHIGIVSVIELSTTTLAVLLESAEAFLEAATAFALLNLLTNWLCFWRRSGEMDNFQNCSSLPLKSTTASTWTAKL